MPIFKHEAQDLGVYDWGEISDDFDGLISYWADRRSELGVRLRRAGRSGPVVYRDDARHFDRDGTFAIHAFEFYPHGEPNGSNLVITDLEASSAAGTNYSAGS